MIGSQDLSMRSLQLQILQFIGLCNRLGMRHAEARYKSSLLLNSSCRCRGLHAIW